MVELAGNGAKVMHHKAAELGHATRTPYAVKGLRSGVGTTVDDDAPVDAERPVTGLTVIRDVTFCRIIQGLTEDADRADVDRDVLARVAERGISIDMVNVNDAGVFFIVDDEHADAVRPALADLNLALRMRPHCSKISVVGAGMRGTSGVMYRVVKAITDAGVEIIHSTDSNITISILVPAERADDAQQALHDAFRLGPRGGRAMKSLGPYPHRDGHAVRRERRAERRRSGAHRAVPDRARQRRRRARRLDRRGQRARDRREARAVRRGEEGARVERHRDRGNRRQQHAPLDRAHETGGAVRRRRRAADGARVRQADAGRHARALRRDPRGDVAAGDHLQHPRPHGGEHAARDVHRAVRGATPTSPGSKNPPAT